MRNLRDLGFKVIDTRQVEIQLEGRNGEPDIIASIGIEDNWRIAQREGVWGYRPTNAAGVKHARGMNVGDGILFYRGQKGASQSGFPSGFVAIGRLTEDAQYPWPAGVPIPWSDSDYAVRLPMELTSFFDPPLQLQWTGGGFSEEVGISRFDLLGGVITEEQVQKIIDTGISNGSTPEAISCIFAWHVDLTRPQVQVPQEQREPKEARSVRA